MTPARRRFPVSVYTVALGIIAVSFGGYLTFRWPVEWYALSLVAALLLSDLGFSLAERRRRKKANVTLSPVPAFK
ncbi:hypothetical protein IV500_05065 [Paeniglutamicibacter antarcticus]|uniref:Uncharacterized protein n=1 Tax=Arthrobacter terrae TaxID=2935737 RepID=A0A931CPU5_9MICC|nr:hypothetical protein [Arthrobacter terrae]MBG0738789.1 hypothetical protein [Arthrobacter terrae]